MVKSAYWWICTMPIRGRIPVLGCYNSEEEAYQDAFIKNLDNPHIYYTQNKDKRVANGIAKMWVLEQSQNINTVIGRTRHILDENGDNY